MPAIFNCFVSELKIGAGQMKKHNPQIAMFIFVIIILLAGLMVYLLSAKANELSRKIIAKGTHENTQRLIDLVDEEEYVIYMLGSVPNELRGINESHLIEIGTNPISEDNMPVYWKSLEYTIYDDLGNEVEHHIPRDYPDNMIIVVNSDYPLDEDSLEIIRNCAVLNHVPVMFVGSVTASSFRDALILIPKNYDPNQIMYFEDGTARDGEILSPGEQVINSRELTDTILRYVAFVIGIETEEN